MSKKFILRTSLIVAAIMATHAHAFEFGKPIVTSVAVTKSGHQLNGAPGRKQITLMSFKLNPKEQQMLYNYTPKKTNLRSTLFPSTIDLGMNNVPVLDQGMHGSCVTFAVTAAVDAVIGKGDYVSQLCQLELGSYLEDKGYMPSGWSGSFGPWVFDQMMRFGFVNKENQKTKTCSNISEYPVQDYTNEGRPMSLGEFKRMSEDLGSYLYPVYHMNFFQRFETKFSDTDQAEQVLMQVKKSLTNGNRLTFGTFIVFSAYCSAGACASHHAKDDTWALTKELQVPPYGTGGHEMVITGYDDNAVAIDNEGKKHQGLLMLRNSWGDDVGDHGNYYMTYDYFKKFAGEVQEVVGFNQQA